MIVSSHQKMENTESKTGVWLGEFTDPYYEFIDAGYQVEVASPAGGQPPIDPMSELTENITASNRRFQEDSFAKQALATTKLLHEVHASEFDALFYPGGHGPLWDLASNEISGRLILGFYKTGKPVGAVCHGPAAFIKVADLSPGFLQGKKITAFTDMEEGLVGRSKNVPYKLESTLKALGANVSSGFPFLSHVETDGLLVTGQNPLSAGPTAKALIEVLEKNTIVL